MSRLKAYTEKFGLITSKEIINDDHMCEAIAELCIYTKVGKVFLTNGKQSKEIKFSYQPPGTRPIYYIRPDGIKVFSLSVNPDNYPMMAHYADGRIEQIL